MKRKTVRLVVATGAVIGATTACGLAAPGGQGDDAVTVWTWDHGMSLPGTAYEEVMTEDLPRMIEEATDGRVVVEPVIGNTDPSETVSAVAAGRFDGGSVVTTAYGGTYPVWTFGEVGFRIADFEEWEEVLRGEPGAFVTAAYEEDTGLIQPGGALPFASVYLFSREPLRTLDDWRGLRLRSQGIEGSALLEELGASPVAMPFGDVYTSIERGVIDGFLTSQNAALSINPWEVVDYMNTWPLGLGYVYPTIRPESLDALDPEVRAQVLEVFDELEELGWEKAKRDERNSTQTMVDQGIEVIQPDQEVLDRLRTEAGASLSDDWLSRAGAQGEDLLEILDP